MDPETSPPSDHSGSRDSNMYAVRAEPAALSSEGESPTAGEMVSESKVAPRSLLKYRPENSIPEFKIHRSSDGLPLSKNHLPISQRPYFRKYYEEQVNMVGRLPPRTLPFHEQVAAYSTLWNSWAAEIRDPKVRDKVVDWTTKRMESVWKHAIDKGMFLVAQSDIAASSTSQVANPYSTENGSKSRRKPRKKPRMEDEPWLFPDGINRFMKGAVRDKSGRVTEAEVKHARASTKAVKARVAELDLEEGNEIFNSTIRRLGRDIEKNDWDGQESKTEENPLGRDLFMYALHEVQIGQMQMIRLRKFFRGFETSMQKSNTMDRIDDVKCRHDHFLALAIELNQNRESEVIEITSDNKDEEEEEDDDDDEESKVSESSRRHRRVAPLVNNKITPTDLEPDDNIFQAQTPGRRRRTSALEKKPVGAPDSHIRVATRPQLPSTRPRPAAAASKPSKITIFRIRPGFNPADHELDTSLKEYKGFHFRFTTNSTLETRRAIHDHLREYVQARRTDKVGLGSNTSSSRFGCYEAFNGRGGRGSKIVAHGYWEQRNRKLTKDSKWFFDGAFTVNSEGEIVRTDGGILGIVREAGEKLTRGQRKRKRYGDDSDNDHDDDYRG